VPNIKRDGFCVWRDLCRKLFPFLYNKNSSKQKKEV